MYGTILILWKDKKCKMKKRMYDQKVKMEKNDLRWNISIDRQMTETVEEQSTKGYVEQ
jgi:hypothetical protein